MTRRTQSLHRRHEAAAAHSPCDKTSCYPVQPVLESEGQRQWSAEDKVKGNESCVVFEAELQSFTDALNSSVESDKWWERV